MKILALPVALLALGIGSAWAQTLPVAPTAIPVPDTILGTVITDYGTASLNQHVPVGVPPTPHGGSSGSGYNDVILTLVLANADKLAVGNTLHWEVDVSTDGGNTWAFNASDDWTSYGPGGLTIVRPDGVTVVNPDPTITVALNGLVSPLYRISYTTNNLLAGHPVVTGK